MLLQTALAPLLLTSRCANSASTRNEPRARLGEDRWDQAYAAGHTATIDSLVKDIDSVRG